MTSITIGTETFSTSDLGLVVVSGDAGQRGTVLSIAPAPFSRADYQEQIRTARDGNTARLIDIGVVAGDKLVGRVAYWLDGEQPWVDAA